MTKRVRDHLGDLLAVWTETDDPPLTGRDRDAISHLRFLLADDEDGPR